MNKIKETQYASHLFIFIMLGLGLPLWWKTTEVYRQELPYKDVESLRESFQIVQEVRLILKVKSINGGELAKVIAKECSLPGKFSVVVTPSNYSVEDETLSYLALNLEDFDASLPELEHYHLQIIEVDKSEKPVVLGRRRNLFFEKKTSLNLLAAVIRSILAEEGPTSVVNQDFDGTSDLWNQLSKLRRFASSSFLNVLFTFSNPDPELFDIDWPIEAAIEEYLQPFADNLKDIVDIRPSSQHIYFAPLGVTPRKALHGDGYEISTDLSLLINPLESKLGEQVLPGPTANLVLLVPPARFHPLHLKNRENSDSFIVHRWGGIAFYNPPKDSNGTHWIDMQPVMETFIGQLRLLIGLDIKLPKDVARISLNEKAIADWEVDYLLRLKTIENIAYSTKAIKSLTALLETITNIVISNDVASNVSSSLESIKKSSRLFEKGMLKESYKESLAASERADAAFFDPSMLALLYFPSDQKYAIYVPLFLPVGIPVLLSTWSLLKSFFASSKTEKSNINEQKEKHHQD
ncbi:GPI transamidase component PIG-S-like isoform X1 [Artemia franciscana]|uniref:GPI transamidase component PIG-S n=1 Tax=Artemia franciscana TaxID=6661 RepID=A0AA88IPD3_ARTSF|nr:hypothetical protein QYM36_008165 [Artemia franciscana]